MTHQTIKSQSILPRIDGITRDLKKLEALNLLPLDIFSQEQNFVLTQFYLRRALEGVFHIGSHILSRLPGGRATEYKEIALKLGQVGVVENGFAQTKLSQMAGYRNRLTHFYADITPDEIYEILQNSIVDFNTFLTFIKITLEHLDKFNLTME